jgi:hypothetical protein
MDVLVTAFAFGAVPVLGMHLWDFFKKKERPITYKVALFWLAGFVTSLALWKAGV